MVFRVFVIRSEPLLFMTVQEEPDGCSISVFICAVGELGVLTLHIDDSVLCDGPLIRSVLSASGFNKICLQFRLRAIVHISVVVCVI